jgi:topoisomerase-4 subunit A
MTRLNKLMAQNFIEYASYVIVDRAIPDLRDGLKPVQRRILTTLFRMDDGKFHKVANVIGDTMKLHPHGDASIGDALVTLANKEYFIEKQGNFGNILTGHAAAAPRYIECRLTELAKETLFRKALTSYKPSYDGRNQEPQFLPVKLPVLLMLGAEGIAVGMSTRILPHNFSELLQAQIEILRNEPMEVFPDFATGGIVDVSDYDDGHGKVKVRAKFDKKDSKTIVIREIPHGTTTDGVIASIEAAAQKGKVKIGAINDFTTEKVEIEVTLARGVYADEVIPQLYAHTDCEVSVSCNMVVIKDRQPVDVGVSDILCFLTDQLRALIKAELELERDQLLDKKHWLDLERIFIENRVYGRIEEAETAEQVQQEVRTGMEPHIGKLKRELSDEDIERLLAIPIRRISRFDIEKNRKDIETTMRALKQVRAKLRKLTATSISYLEYLLEKYGELYPRRSEIAAIEAVDVRAVSRHNLRLAYDPKTGFFGTAVKGDKFQFDVSEYDKILLVSRDGSYRIIGPESKVLIPKVIYCKVFDPEQGVDFTVVYRTNERMVYGKKVHIRAFIHGREYELIKDRKGRIDLLIEGDTEDAVHMDFVPMKRQRVREHSFELSELEATGVTARGRRLAPKAVARIKRIRRENSKNAEDKLDPEPKADPGEQKELF